MLLKWIDLIGTLKTTFLFKWPFSLKKKNLFLACKEVPEGCIGWNIVLRGSAVWTIIGNLIISNRKSRHAFVQKRGKSFKRFAKQIYKLLFFNNIGSHKRNVYLS